MKGQEKKISEEYNQEGLGLRHGMGSRDLLPNCRQGWASRHRIINRVWDFGMVWEAEIYSQTAGKDGRPDLEQLTGDMIDISEWLKFKFYDLVCFWNNQSDDTKPMMGQCLGVSHRVGGDLCY